MSHIFLSYSRRDAAYVDALAQTIRSGGHRTWVDREGIRGGEQWRREIVEAIKQASLMIIFLSPNSARSDNVRKELDIADGSGVKILPAMLAPVQVPNAMQYQLAGMQLIELWRDRERGADTLLKAIAAYGLRGAAPRGSPARQAAPTNDQPQLDLARLGGASLLDGLRNVNLFGRKR